MPTITLRDLQPLLEQFSGEGAVLSCYADLGVSEGFRHDWEQEFKAKADALRKVTAEDGRTRQEWDQNLSAAHRAVKAAARGGSRWIAAFSATRRGFFHTITFDLPIETDLVIDHSPYLVPLLGAIHRRREYLAVHTDTHRGRLYVATPGAVRSLAEVEGDVPPHQHSAGERWGIGQATIARHREDCILRYRKELVAALDNAWRAADYTGLILLGEHEVLKHVRATLPARLQARVLREVPESWYEKASQIEGKIRLIASDQFTREEVEVVTGFWDLLEGGKVVSGPRAVLTAIQSGQFGTSGYGYIVLGPDPREAVGRCIACRTLSPDPLATCPRCQAPCAPGNLWEELLLTALQHGIIARFVADPQKLKAHGQAVAVLPKAGSIQP